MKVKRKQTCPQKVIEKLLQWEKKGWLTVDLTDDVENDVEVLEPQTSVTKEESSQEPIEVLWVKRLKSIAKKLSKSLDNQVVITNKRGYPGSYKFKFNSKAFCNMMDELLNNYSSDIKTIYITPANQLVLHSSFLFLEKYSMPIYSMVQICKRKI